MLIVPIILAPILIAGFLNIDHYRRQIRRAKEEKHTFAFR